MALTTSPQHHTMSPAYAKNVLFTRLKATSVVRGTTMDSEKYIMSSEKLLFRQPPYPGYPMSIPRGGHSPCLPEQRCF